VLAERLVGELVGAGAVPPLLRLRGLGFPRCTPAFINPNRNMCRVRSCSGAQTEFNIRERLSRK